MNKSKMFRKLKIAMLKRAELEDQVNSLTDALVAANRVASRVASINVLPNAGNVDNTGDIESSVESPVGVLEEPTDIVGEVDVQVLVRFNVLYAGNSAADAINAAKAENIEDLMREAQSVRIEYTSTETY